MKKTCVFSRPVQTVVDELTTALLQRLGDREGAEMLMSVAENVDRRLSDYRHDRYKGRKALQMVVARLPEAPDELLVKLDLKKAVDVSEPGGIDLHTEVPLSLIAEGLAAEKEAKVQETNLEDALDELEATPIPTFDDFKDVFRRYPHIMRIKGYEHHPNGFRDLLVLGYSSNRNPETDQLIRRNCAFRYPDEHLSMERTFNDLGSIFPPFHKEHKGYHFTIKVIPYQPGMSLRFWTNIQGVGDNVRLNRFVFVSHKGLIQVKSREHLAALHQAFVGSV